MKVFASRLKPYDDLRQSLKNFAKQEDIKVGLILSAIGSLEEAKIRFANQDISTVLTEKFEIITHFIIYSLSLSNTALKPNMDRQVLAITVTAYGDS
ncbi:PPC domain-containing DNA-binding protein [Nostoc sp.]|uniref:PPC domain-containing DNA-binding protein n=1 Tax=Nostoc sp. TaxID=1180 RepID=UPI002FF9420E